MVTITEPAAEFLLRTRERSGAPANASLRIGAPGYDGDASVVLEFVAAPLSGDAVTDAHGLVVCVAPELTEALDAATIDVVDRAGEEQLVLRNVD